MCSWTELGEETTTNFDIDILVLQQIARRIWTLVGWRLVTVPSTITLAESRTLPLLALFLVISSSFFHFCWNFNDGIV